MIDKRPKVGLGVLIFNDNNEVLLGQRLNAHGHETWGPPGGHLEYGESFVKCAHREVFEETGLNIYTFKYLTTTNDIFTKDNLHYVSVFMTAKYSSTELIHNKEPDKVLMWKFFKLNNLPGQLFLSMKNLLSLKILKP